MEQRIRMSDELVYFSPALLTQQIYNAIAGSDMAQMLAFDKASYKYFNQWNAYLDQRIYFRNNRFTKKDFKGLRAYQFKPVINYRIIWFQMLCLFVMAAVLWFIGSKNFDRPLEKSS